MNVERRHVAVKIYARERPLPEELEGRGTNILTLCDNHNVAMKCGYHERKYNFEHVFDEYSAQEDVYHIVVAPMVGNAIAGFNCTIIAFGPTGSGKTYTMFGSFEDNSINFRRAEDRGMIPQVAHNLFFQLIKLNPKIEYTVRISFIAIYNESVHDLLNEGTALRMYDDPASKGAVFLKDIFKVTVLNSTDICDWLNIGLAQFFKSFPDVNQRNRTHTIFTFNIDLREVTMKGEEIIKSGKLQLVDIAGSENAIRIGNCDIRGREGANINRSIITFHKVIKALVQKMQHIPYRDSKLTRILQDSFGGNTKTAMITTFIPNSAVWDETASSLDVTQVARSIINFPYVNINKRQASLFDEMKNEILKLKEELAAARSGKGFYVSTEAYKKMNEDVEKNNKKIIELIGKIREMEDVGTVMERQQKDLLQSFEHTKTYLDSMKLQLEMKRIEVTQAEKVVYELTKKRDKLAKTANHLLNICEDVTKHEDIFYNKYEDKCNANENNVGASEEMLDTAASTMDNCSKIIDGNVELRNEYFEQTKKVSYCMIKRNDNVVQGVNALSSDITVQLQRLYLTMHKALAATSAEACITNTHKVISDIYRKTLSDEAEKTKIKDQLLASREKLDSLLAELFEKSGTAIDNIKKSFLNREYYVEECTKTFGDLDQDLVELEQKLIEKYTETQEALYAANMQVVKAKEEEHQLFLDIKRWESHNILLSKATKGHQRFLTKEGYKVSEVAFVHDLNHVVCAQKSLIDKVIKDIDEHKIMACSHAKNSQDNMKHYINKMVGHINVYLFNKVNEHQKNLGDWQAMINDLICGVPDFRDKYNDMENYLGNIAISLQIQNDEISKTIAETREKLQQLDNGICFTGHMGDTPAKPTYQYPQNVDESFNESTENDNEIEEAETDGNNV